MKYILAFSLLFLATFTIAQVPAVPQASLVAASLSQLTEYTGSLVQANWTDTLRGGRFDLVYNTSIGDDDGVYFAATGKGDGYHWRRNIESDLALNVKWFGAVADSSTICDSAFARTFRAAQALGINQVDFPAGRAYITTNTVKVPANVSAFMDAPIYYRGPDDRPALVVGDSSVRTANMNYRLYVFQEAAVPTWNDEDNVGIVLVNLFTCNSIAITECSRFTIGVQCLGINGLGFSYNNVYFGRIVSNKIGLDLHRGGGAGWVNENNFYGGRFAVTSNKSGTDRYGIRISSVDAGASNNNNFYKTSFEISGPSALPGIALPIVIEKGINNKFIDCRDESNYSVINTVFAQTFDVSANNVIDLGYSNNPDPIVQDLGIYPTTIFVSRSSEIAEKSYTNIFTSGDIVKKVTPYNSTNLYFPDELNAYGVSGPSAFLASYVLTDSSLNMGSIRGVSVRVSTKTCKQFVVRRNVVEGNPGRVFVKCFDVYGNALADSDSLYATGTSINRFIYSGSFGGGYSIATDNSNNIYFRVKDTVNYIDIVLNGGTDSLKLKGFTVQAVNGKASVINLKTKLGRYATSAPATGTWELGTFIFNAAGTTIGWICTAAGTPGTWTSVPIPLATTAVIQNQNASAQTSSNFWISGTGTAASFVSNTVRVGGGSSLSFPNNSGNSVVPQSLTTVTANVAVAGVVVNDGTRNRRIGLYVDDSSATRSYGLTSTFSSDSRPFNIRDGSNVFLTIAQNGRVGINTTTSPTAYLHLTAGGSGVAGAPLKFTAGTLLTIAESGAMETDASNELFYSNSTTTASRGYVHIDRYVAKTSTYTITANDGTINCTSGTFTVTLPTAVGIAGREYVIVNTGSGTITLATTSSQTFANTSGTPTTLTLAQFDNYKVASNGANWLVYRWTNNTVSATTPTGNYGNIQLNRNSAFATPASDSLNFSSAALNVKGGLTVTGSITTAYVAKTATYAIAATDNTIDCTSGTFTVTLPTAVGITGKIYTIVNSGSGTISIATTSSQTFTNITSTPTGLSLAPVGTNAVVSYTVKSTGANWIVIAKVKNEDVAP